MKTILIILILFLSLFSIEYKGYIWVTELNYQKNYSKDCWVKKNKLIKKDYLYVAKRKIKEKEYGYFRSKTKRVAPKGTVYIGR